MSLHAGNALALPDKTRYRTALMQRDIRHLQQRRTQRLDQTRVTHIRHIRHMQRTSKSLCQGRHCTLHIRHGHFTQRPPLTPRPRQRLRVVIQVQPIQPRRIHLRIHLRLRQQLLTQLRIKILRPMRQRRHRRAVTPRIKRRNDAAAGPGGFTARVLTFNNRDRLRRESKPHGRHQPNNTTA